MKKIFTLLLVFFVTLVLTASDIIIYWNHGGPTSSVSGYQIHYGVSNRIYTNFVVTGYTTNTIISNIPPGILFYYSGKTISPNGEVTDFGNEFEFMVRLPTNTLPSEVKDFRLTIIK